MSKRCACLMLAAMLLGGCVLEHAEPVAEEVRRLELQANRGVGEVEQALADPELSSTGLGGLGEGVRIVDAATRQLSALEADDRASDVQQLMAMVVQARVWDGVARAFHGRSAVGASDDAGLDEGQRAVVESVLGDKAAPAQAQALSAFRRARARACDAGLSQMPVMIEILNGLVRYGESHISLGKPCSGR